MLSAFQSKMSALPPKADMCGAAGDVCGTMSNVRFGPKADSCTAANSISIPAPAGGIRTSKTTINSDRGLQAPGKRAEALSQ
jgi:hypothetical protein